MKKLLLIVIFISTGFNLFAQSSAGSKTIYDARFIVDMPTAGVLPVKTLSGYGMFFSSGGLFLAFDIAVIKNVNIGLSYSGINLLGEGDVILQKWPGFDIRWRIIDEKKFMPAILVGVSNQGRGKYYKEYKRFQTMAPGVYGAVSKSFTWALGYFALHGGINYSWEQPSGQYVPNLWLGFEHSVGHRVSIHLEFNPNLADTKEDVMSNRLLLNAEIRWSVFRGVTLEFIMHDLFNHTKNNSGFERWIGVEFIHSF
jgi:hypothetical protein